MECVGSVCRNTPLLLVPILGSGRDTIKGWGKGVGPPHKRTVEKDNGMDQ